MKNWILEDLLILRVMMCDGSFQLVLCSESVRSRSLLRLRVSVVCSLTNHIMVVHLSFAVVFCL